MTTLTLNTLTAEQKTEIAEWKSCLTSKLGALAAKMQALLATQKEQVASLTRTRALQDAARSNPSAELVAKAGAESGCAELLGQKAAQAEAAIAELTLDLYHHCKTAREFRSAVCAPLRDALAAEITDKLAPYFHASFAAKVRGIVADTSAMTSLSRFLSKHSGYEAPRVKTNPAEDNSRMVPAPEPEPVMREAGSLVAAFSALLDGAPVWSYSLEESK